MLRRGTSVTRLMQRVGQRAPTGRIIDVRTDSYEILWENGRTSISDPVGIIRAKNHKKT